MKDSITYSGWRCGSLVCKEMFFKEKYIRLIFWISGAIYSSLNLISRSILLNSKNYLSTSPPPKLEEHNVVWSKRLLRNNLDLISFKYIFFPHYIFWSEISIDIHSIQCNLTHYNVWAHRLQNGYVNMFLPPFSHTVHLYLCSPHRWRC